MVPPEPRETKRVGIPTTKRQIFGYFWMTLQVQPIILSKKMDTDGLVGMTMCPEAKTKHEGLNYKPKITWPHRFLGA
jgi:hypothetical protein